MKPYRALVLAGIPFLSSSLPAQDGPGVVPAADSPTARLHERARDWRRVHGPSWQVVPDGRSGWSQLVWGGRRAPAFVPTVDGDFDLLARAALRESEGMHGIDEGTLVLDRVQFLALGIMGTTDKMSVRYTQAKDGLRVRHGSVNVLFDMEGGLLSIQTTATRELGALSTTPSLRASEGRISAVSSFRSETNMRPTYVSEPVLTIAQTPRGEPRVPVLAWEIEVLFDEEGFRPEGTRYWIDAQRGTVAARESLVHAFDVSGTVCTIMTAGTAPDVNANHTTVPVPFAEVVGDGQGPVLTDENGDFTFPGVNNVNNVEVRYQGPYINVDSDLVGSYVLSAGNLAGANNNLLMNPAPNDQSLQTAQANAFVTITGISEWTRAINPQDDTADFESDVTVNYLNNNSACQGGTYKGGNLDLIRMFRYQGGNPPCYNGSYSTIIAHEYGHQLNAKYGTKNDYGMGEANADVWAFYYFDTPCFADDYWTAAPGCVRSGLNVTQWCGYEPNTWIPDLNCHGGDYLDGEVWMGTAWKIRENLNATHGNAAGDLIADCLFLGWMNAYDQETIAPVIRAQWFAIDDDDGDICTGTPNYDDIDDGFVQHGFNPAYTPGFCWAISDIIGILDGGDEIGPYLTTVEVDPPGGGGAASVTLRYEVEGGSTLDVSMTNTGGNTWEGSIPGQASPARVSYWFVAMDAAGGSATFPEDAPAERRVFHVGTFAPILEADFESGAGWSVENENVANGAWERAAPLGSLYTPDEDNPDGAGTLCWMTEQYVLGELETDSDVDGGPTRLVSPRMDLAGLRAFVDYAYWIVNPLGDDALVVEVSYDDGAAWVEVARHAGGDAQEWRTGGFMLPPATLSDDEVRLRFSAEDPTATDDMFEVALDDVRVRLLAPSDGCIDTSRYCLTAPNSFGPGGTIGSAGDPSVGANDFDLTARLCPPNKPGLFYYGSGQLVAPFGDGFRCVGGMVVARLNPPVVIDAAGMVSYDVDFTLPPADAGPSRIDPFATWYFQFWFRDPMGPGGTGFNLTDGLRVTFCP